MGKYEVFIFTYSIQAIHIPVGPWEFPTQAHNVDFGGGFVAETESGPFICLYFKNFLTTIPV